MTERPDPTAHLSPAARFQRTHAATPRPAVDSNGHPTGPPMTYTYGPGGRLERVDVDDRPTPDAA